MYGMLFLFTKIVVKQLFLMFSQSPLENLHTLNDCIGCVNKNVYKIMTCLHTYVVCIKAHKYIPEDTVTINSEINQDIAI